MSSDLLNSRNGVGAAIGGTVGFFMAGPMGAGLGALLGGAVAHASQDTQFAGEMTPARRIIFAKAMESISDPKELRALADAFASQGLKAEAEMLKKRAALRELPEEKQLAYRDAFRRAMASDDSEAIETLSDAFLHAGALRAARALKDHANAVRAAKSAATTKAPQANLEDFAEKLGQAVAHFGPESQQATSAARLFIQAQGKQVTKDLVDQTISAAVSVVSPPATVSGEAEPVMVNEGGAPEGKAIDVQATVVEE